MGTLITTRKGKRGTDRQVSQKLELVHNWQVDTISEGNYPPPVSMLCSREGTSTKMLSKLFRRKNSVLELPQQPSPISRRSPSTTAVFAGEECERCGTTGTRIVYGLPTVDTESVAQRGEIVLGGCRVEVNQPTHSCSNCKARWRIESQQGY